MSRLVSVNNGFCGTLCNGERITATPILETHHGGYFAYSSSVLLPSDTDQDPLHRTTKRRPLLQTLQNVVIVDGSIAFATKILRPTGSLHPVGCLDWCHACGRVASERDLGKKRSTPFHARVGRNFVGNQRNCF